MRSTDHNVTGTGTAKAQRFGALISDLASKAGYDLVPGSGGRAALARDAHMSAASVGRMLEGRALPLPQQYESLARAVHADVRMLLVTAEVISAEAWPEGGKSDVLSATHTEPLSPEGAAERWGITEPGIRDMLIASVRQAIRLQNEANSRRTNNEQGEAVARR
ncbi:hypothetical protein GCM10010387_16480 [Streptomyces inusitatus]|uniref:HTH cro/C1-type domain-containing protein n=1 Tax=Streptomyces inusitatus TaxID=68221 RepID=A0A918PWZ6_9ACTN|nr:XRE family transcriptional regulator [Streptomyces inusitatus]GGZ23921.1 hypothetical protein GCM10010387_16480 [Streptomyces inusitatus]